MTHFSRKSAAQITWKNLGVTLAWVIGLLGVAGVWTAFVHGETARAARWFDLDRELNAVTFFSSFLLIAAGWLAARLARERRLPRSAGWLAGFFVFMGFDEALKIHETLEKVTGIDWQILYVPMVIPAGLAWAVVWWRSRRLTRWLWTGGALGWVISQLLEAAQWGWWASGDADREAELYRVLMVSEELLEMTGSALFLLALFRWCWPDGCRFKRPLLEGEGLAGSDDAG